MNAKKFAVKGLIVIAAVVAVCMFFSGTIRSIATAKVKITQPRQGKLTQSVELAASIVYTENEPFYIEGGEGMTLDIISVKAAAGYEVEEGDLLFEAEVSGYDETMTQYREAFYEAQDALNELENSGVRLKRTEEEWAKAYQALSEARGAALDTDILYRARLSIEGFDEDETDGLPEGASDELEALYSMKVQTEEEYDAAQAAMDKAERYSVSDEARNYITESIKQQEAMEEAEENMLALAVLNESVAKIYAPDDGYITEMNVKAGETFDAAASPYGFCPKKEYPVLRCDTTDCPLTISKGMDAMLTGSEGYDIESKVIAVGVTLEGGKYADVELDRGTLKDMGGLYPMVMNGATVTVEYKAKRATTLLPAAAVRGSGEERYVFVLRTEETAFGAKKNVVARQDVTVLAESDGTISVEEDLSYMQVAYMEDREIAEGDAVMEYAE